MHPINVNTNDIDLIEASYFKRDDISIVLKKRIGIRLEILNCKEGI